MTSLAEPLPAQPDVTRSRGMRDLLPATMRAFRLAEDAFRASAIRWGYEEIRTPTIENYSLFTWLGALTPEMLGRVYSFLDWDGWSGERVVLRPDSTIPVSRAFRDSGLTLPARLFYVQNVFRFSPDEAHDRETWQLGLEYFDAPEATGDAETVLVAVDTLRQLGLTPSVRVSHAGLLDAIANAGNGGDSGRAGASAGEVLETARTNAALRPLVEVMMAGAGGAELLGNIASLAAAVAPGAVEPARELERLVTMLMHLGVDVAAEPGLSLDFEYYVGPVFEISAGGVAIATGGRYAPPGGGTPGTSCGLAIDVDELLVLLGPGSRSRSVVRVVPAAAGDVPEALAVARKLHGHGIAAAIGQSTAPGAVTVEVAGTEVAVLTSDGRHTAGSIEDLLGRLLEYK